MSDVNVCATAYNSPIRTLVHAESADALGEEVTITEGSINEEQKADDPSVADGEKIEELQPLEESMLFSVQL